MAEDEMTQTDYENLTPAEHERFEGGYAAFLLNGKDSLRSAYIAGYSTATAQLAPYQKALAELVWITEYNLDAQLACENGSAIPQNHERLMAALSAAKELLDQSGGNYANKR